MIDERAHGSLDEIRRELAEVVDQLLALAPEDTVTRAQLRERQAALRTRAAELRDELPEDPDQLRARIAQLERRLESIRSRRIAPVVGGGGGSGGGGIDGAARMRLNRQIDAAGGAAEVEHEIAVLHRRLDRVTGR